MNRQELLQYIKNSILLGNVVTDCQDFYAVRALKREFICESGIKSFMETINGSVEYNRMYLKEENGEIILTLYTGNYEEIDLGDMVDIIGPFAFMCSESPMEITGPRVRKIGTCAFAKCGVRIARFHSLREIEPECFYNSRIRDIEAPLLQVISQGAFNECRNLYSLTFESVTMVCKKAFCNSSLPCLIAHDLKIVLDSAFENCQYLNYVGSQNIENIAASAFRGCGRFYSIASENLLYIGNNAFQNSGLTEITCPAKSIGNNAFASCDYLKKVEFVSNDLRHISGAAFADCLSLEKASFKTIKSIEECAFANCINLKEFDISSAPKTIGSRAFLNCITLENVNLDINTWFHQDSFKNCINFSYSLKMFINKKLKGKNCKMDRNELVALIRNSILIGNTVTTEDIKAFDDDEYLEEYRSAMEKYVDGSIEVSDMYFKEVDGKVVLTLCLGEYTTIDLGNAVDVIAPYAFVKNQNLRVLTSESVTTILKNSFMSCKNLSAVIAPNLRYIDNYAFSDCAALSSISLDSIEYIGKEAFKGCTALEIKFNEKNLSNLKYLHPMAFSSPETNERVKVSGLSKSKQFKLQLTHLFMARGNISKFTLLIWFLVIIAGIITNRISARICLFIDAITIPFGIYTSTNNIEPVLEDYFKSKEKHKDTVKEGDEGEVKELKTVKEAEEAEELDELCS